MLNYIQHDDRLSNDVKTTVNKQKCVNTIGLRGMTTIL